MNQNWPMVRIGDVIIENPKSTLKVRDSNEGGRYPFFTSGMSSSSFNDYLCSGKNLFIATGGKACVQYFDGYAAYSTDCYSLTSRHNTLPKFLFYFLESILTDIDEQMFKGAALRHLQKNLFRDIMMPLPPLSEQQQIVATLDEVLDGITRAKANIEANLQNVTEIERSTLENAFQEISPRCRTAELGHLIVTLTDYHANGSYEVLKDNVELKETEDYAWMVRSTDFENGFKNDKRYISRSAYDFLRKSRVLGGEIIMSKIGNAGKVYLMPEINRPCSLAMNLFLIRLNDDIAANKYVYRFLKSRRGEAQIRTRLNGVATLTITKDSVRTIRVPLPPRPIQDQLVANLDDLEAETQHLESVYERKLAAISELKNSILRHALAGKLQQLNERS